MAPATSPQGEAAGCLPPRVERQVPAGAPGQRGRAAVTVGVTDTGGLSPFALDSAARVAYLLATGLLAGAALIAVVSVARRGSPGGGDY